MEFDKSKVYTALNATEDLIGAKGYFADCLGELNSFVDKEDRNIETLRKISTHSVWVTPVDFYNFFYLVEPAPDKWYVYRADGKGYQLANNHSVIEIENRESYCKVFEGTEEECKQFIEKHSKKYRPFKDCDELIETYNHNFDIIFDGIPAKDLQFMPTIWVKHKSIYTKHLIIDFGDNFCSISHPARNELKGLTLEELFENYTFLDGSPCGVIDD